jgi:uncharacterized protein YheU (UPF0270 family)
MRPIASTSWLSWRYDAPLLAVIVTAGLLSRTHGSWIYKPRISINNLLEEFVFEAGDTKGRDLRLEVRRIRSGASRDVIWLDFNTSWLSWRYDAPLLTVIVTAGLLSRTYGSWIYKPQISINNLLEEFVLEAGDTKGRDLRLEVRRIRSGASRDVINYTS